ncbi:hypothetical protein I551_9085 [Mycobacterium ulcerans str. Harvey]|uniref:Uncharacterized protein n=1 Tax=Mycobacterium ulcerans str. Harvey TaxID=1299332 RepID=A0ABN0R9W2_MYCUL|nr:hypothetical protein I551_9085 [Mycobacterium ulcerans str. Harvey]
MTGAAAARAAAVEDILTEREDDAQRLPPGCVTTSTVTMSASACGAT